MLDSIKELKGFKLLSKILNLSFAKIFNSPLPPITDSTMCGNDLLFIDRRNLVSVDNI